MRLFITVYILLAELESGTNAWRRIIQDIVNIDNF